MFKDQEIPRGIPAVFPRFWASLSTKCEEWADNDGVPFSLAVVAVFCP